MGGNGDGMVIERFAFTEVIVPAKAGVINSDALAKPLHMLPVGGKASWSVQFDTLPKLILKLHLSNGVVGLGEFYRDCQWERVRAIAEALVGIDLRDLSLQKLPLPISREYDGFECAIWDAYAKSFGLPLHALIGGKVRDAVKITSWSSHRTIDEVGEWVAQYHRQGFDCIKFKTDLEDDVIKLALPLVEGAQHVGVRMPVGRTLYVRFLAGVQDELGRQPGPRHDQPP